jgi:WD40 repeat protein
MLVKAVQAHQDQIHRAKLSSDGQMLVTVSSDRICKLWDVSNNQFIKRA